MRHDHEHRPNTDDKTVKTPAPSSHAERRRLLLKGLGKGTAVVAAVSPIKSMAYTAALTGTGGKICSISGVQSGAHSKTTITAICGGRNVAYYQDNLPHWPGYSAGPPAHASFSNGATSFNELATFASVFGGGSSTPVFNIVRDSPASDEAHWVVALLNANVTKVGYVAPYSPAEVKAFYGGSQPAAALAFFQGYMETLTN